MPKLTPEQIERAVDGEYRHHFNRKLQQITSGDVYAIFSEHITAKEYEYIAELINQPSSLRSYGELAKWFRNKVNQYIAAEARAVAGEFHQSLLERDAS